MSLSDASQTYDLERSVTLQTEEVSSNNSKSAESTRDEFEEEDNRPINRKSTNPIMKQQFVPLSAVSTSSAGNLYITTKGSLGERLRPMTMQNVSPLRSEMKVGSLAEMKDGDQDVSDQSASRKTPKGKPHLFAWKQISSPDAIQTASLESLMKKEKRSPFSSLSPFSRKSPKSTEPVTSSNSPLAESTNAELNVPTKKLVKAATDINFVESSPTAMEQIKQDYSQYHFLRVYRENMSFTTLMCQPTITMTELLELACRKFFLNLDDGYALFLEDPNGERILRSYECPIKLQLSLLENMGFGQTDDINRIGRQDLGFLFRFTIKPKSSLGTQENSCVMPQDSSMFMGTETLLELPQSLIQTGDHVKVVDLACSRNLQGIPEDIAKSLTGIRQLLLTRCLLTTIPTISKLVTLTVLDLSYNQLISVDNCGMEMLENLEFLNLSHNMIENVPASMFCAEPKIKRLDLSMNKLSTLSPELFQKLSRTLEYFDASFCRLKGKVPEGMCELKFLQTLKLAFNALTGGLPWGFGELRHLSKVDIRGNSLGESFGFEEAPVLGVLSRCRNIEVIRADGNRIRWVGRWRDRGESRNPARPSNMLLTSELESPAIPDPDCDDDDADSSGPVGPSRLLEFSKLKLLSISMQLGTAKIQRSMTVRLSNLGNTLMSLNLSNSGIERLPHKMFEKLRSLEILNLSNNKLKEIPPFAVLSKGVHGKLGSHSEIAHVDVSKLCGALHLKEIRLGFNILERVPREIQFLTELRILEVQFNNLKELPVGLWSCASLKHLNASYNSLRGFPDPDGDEGEDHNLPPLPPQLVELLKSKNNANTSEVHGSLGRTRRRIAKGMSIMSTTSTSSSQPVQIIKGRDPLSALPGFLPPLSYSLKTLYLAGNNIDEDIALPLFYLPELQQLNLACNVVADISPLIVANPLPSIVGEWFTNLHVLVLSCNTISSIPSEIEKLRELRALYLNGNRLQTVPGELSKLVKLRAFDLSCQLGGKGIGTSLRYNVTNWPYDWNWNWNLDLGYLNLSGNKRLEIKQIKDPRNPFSLGQNLAEFNHLTKLSLLGLMDVTCVGHPPDETSDKRVRTTASDITFPTLRKGVIRYGFADVPASKLLDGTAITLKTKSQENASNISYKVGSWDLVYPSFRGIETEVLFGVFEGDGSSKGNRIAHYLYEHFASSFKEQLDTKAATTPVVVPETQQNAPSDMEVETVSHIKEALRRTFVQINLKICELYDAFNDELDTFQSAPHDGSAQDLYGCSATVVYMIGSSPSTSPRTCSVFTANLGDGLVFVSRNEGAVEILTQSHCWEREALLSSTQILKGQHLTRKKSTQKSSNSSPTNSDSQNQVDTSRDSEVNDLCWAHKEWARIQQADGWISPQGLVNSTSKVTRGVGFLPAQGAIYAVPSVSYTKLEIEQKHLEPNEPLPDVDEFIAIVSSSIWSSIGMDYGESAKRICSTIRSNVYGSSGREDTLQETSYEDALKLVGEILPPSSDNWGYAAMKIRDAALALSHISSTDISNGGAIMLLGLKPPKKKQATALKAKTIIAKPASIEIPIAIPEKSETVANAILSKELTPPTDAVTLVFTDIQNSTEMWENQPVAMKNAIKVHNAVMRKALRECQGYEVKTEGDAFMVAFQDPLRALEWCLKAQLELRDCDWPKDILEMPGAGELWYTSHSSDGSAGTFASKLVIDGKQASSKNATLLFRGLRIRMGLHCGFPLCEVDPTTNRMDYYGPMVNRASRVASKPAGGQIYVSSAVMKDILLRTKYDPVKRESPDTATAPTIQAKPALRIDTSSNRLGSSTSIGPRDSRSRSDLSNPMLALLPPQTRQDFVDGEDLMEFASVYGDASVDALHKYGIHAWLVGEFKLKGLETPETIYAVYAKELKQRKAYFDQGTSQANLSTVFISTSHTVTPSTPQIHISSASSPTAPTPDVEALRSVEQKLTDLVVSAGTNWCNELKLKGNQSEGLSIEKGLANLHPTLFTMTPKSDKDKLKGLVRNVSRKKSIMHTLGFKKSKQTSSAVSMEDTISETSSTHSVEPGKPLEFLCERIEAAICTLETLLTPESEENIDETITNALQEYIEQKNSSKL